MNECLPTEAGEKSLPPFVITLLFSLGFDGFDVIPANAGIQVPRRMTTLRLFVSLSFARLKEEKKTPKQNPWIPACAGMTAVVNSDQGGRFCESLISSSTSNRSLFGVVEKAPLTRGVGGFMARKDGGESEGIVLYPSRSPSLGWKPTPPGPPCQGGKGHAPDEGFFNSPSSVAIDLAYPADMLRRACTNTTVRTMMA